MYSQLTGLREYPCPDESVSLEDAIKDQLDELNPELVDALADYCEDKLETPAPLLAALILEMGWRRRWDTTRGHIGRRNESLADALSELVDAIETHKNAFIEHEAERRLKVAEEIKHEEAA